MVAKFVFQAFLSKNKFYAGIAKNILNAFFRIRGVNGYVSGAGFENAQQKDNHFRRTFHA